MVRKTPDYLRRHVECTSIGGAKIQDIKKKVAEEIQRMEERSLLVIQGGGNNLEENGPEETVTEVIEAVKAAEGKKMSVAVVGVLRRPREDVTYERMRRATNRRIFEEVTRMKVKWMKEGGGEVNRKERQ